MNTIYKSKWNESTCTWVACSELVRGKTKNNCIKIAAAIALALTSISSYAADAVPCQHDDNPPPPNVTVSGSDSICKLTTDPHNLISVNDNATIEGETIIATGVRRPVKGDSHTIWLQGSSTLIADDVRTINQRKDIRSSALNIQDNSKAKIQNDLTAINSGSTGDIINISDNSILIVNNNLEIKDSSDKTTNAIKNQDSTIVVDGTINITREEKRISTGNGSIYNQNGEIKAKNIKIDQGTKNFAIQQISSTSGTKPSSINVKEKLEITTGTILGKSAIQLESGSISVGGQTFINTFTNPEDGNEENSAIYIKNGQYQAGGGALITINTEDDDGPRENTAATGIILGSGGTFTNNGEVKVNEGKNTVIATDNLSKTQKAIVNNETNGTIFANLGIDAIRHKSEGGILEIQNEGEITGKISNKKGGDIHITNETNGKLINSTINNEGAGQIILTNKGTGPNTINNIGAGNIEIVNEATLGGLIDNKDTGTINITNNDSLLSAISNTGGKIPDKDNIKITNNGEMNNNHIQNKEGNILIKNNNRIQAMNIINNSGNITLINEEDSLANLYDIINSSSNKLDKITLNNSGNLNARYIINQGAGEIVINNDSKGIIESASLRTEFQNLNNNGKININNNGTLQHVLINNHANLPNPTNIPEIHFINQKTFKNSGIQNRGLALIEATNKGTFKDINISNIGAGRITFTNTGNFENDGFGNDSIYNSSGIIEATNNGTFKEINIRNNNAGEITFTNTETGNFENGNIDNRSGTIKATNNGTFKNINISNDSAGEITFTNTGDFENGTISNNSGIIKATNNNAFKDINIHNDGAGEITFTNTGTGTFTGTTNNINNPSTYNSNGTLELKNLGTWTNTGDSTLTNLTNQGTIKFNEIKPADAGNTSKYHSIQVNGNYTGDTVTHIENINKDNAKSKIQVTTLWNQDDSGATDHIKITGDVTGATWVDGIIYGNINKPEENEVDSQSVIRVNGTIDLGSGFKGSAKVQSSASEAQLKRIEHEDGKTDFVWTLFAETKPDPVKPAPIDPIEPPPIDPIEPAPTEPVKPINPVPPKRVPIYAEPVSGYVQMPTANMELGFTTIGTLHERRSENQTNNINSANNTAFSDTQQQTWGRVVVEHLDKNGKKRLDTGGSQSVLQIGHDFILDNNAKTGARRHIGGYVSYGHNENDFRDQYRAENGYIVDDHYTGKGRTDAVSIGGYGTFYGNNGGYVDLVSQVTYLRNKYNARSNESVHQNGWGAALSAEAGKSFIVYGNNWFVEPQAQLVYQYLSLDDFNDRYRHIDQHNPSALRGRMGMRFGYNGDTTDNLPPSSFYGIANIWHDFVNPKSVDIGRDTLKEEYAKTWGEIGAGIQWSITRQSDFYGDVRYEKNFGSDKRKGFKGTLGYKYTWL